MARSLLALCLAACASSSPAATPAAAPACLHDEAEAPRGDPSYRIRIGESVELPFGSAHYAVSAPAVLAVETRGRHLVATGKAVGTSAVTYAGSAGGCGTFTFSVR